MTTHYFTWALKGCDASILISTKPESNELAEKDALENKDLCVEAYDGINKARALVETSVLELYFVQASLQLWLETMCIW